jgi:flagellar protein FliT
VSLRRAQRSRTAAGVLASYRLLDATVARMLALARGRRWAQLPTLDARCAVIVDRLASVEAPPLSAEQRAELVRLTRAIEAARRQLAAIVHPQFSRLLRGMRERQAEPWTRPSIDPEQGT